MHHNGIKGPRPLSLHLANSRLIWDEASKTASSVLTQNIWHKDIAERLEAYKSKLAAAMGPDAAHDDALDACIRACASARKNSFVHGINKYISNGFEPNLNRDTVRHHFGCVTVHDYGSAGAEAGTPILLAPSLVNPFYIMDLMPERSLALYLKEQGYRPFLIDWGSPGDEERAFGIEDYIVRRFKPVLEHVVAVAGGPVPLIGYCMGGTLSAALATRAQGLISKLILLAAPWNFATKQRIAGRQNATEMLAVIEKLMPGADVSVDMLQIFFTNVDPTLSDRKFRAYHAGKYQGADADFFSAMEMWANNGPMLARQVACDCLEGWYRHNLPYKGQWHIGGRPVLPEEIECPVWVAAPKEDRLVPQDSAFGIVESLRDCEKHEPPSGHIGMVVGNRARRGLWEPMLKWLERQ
ncbi:MAG: alpha/beta hydrolase [Kordiimonadaceae bacterium]|nr:alpha/beta hydrolase [Kordiimonadaceae bacterium]